MKFVFCLLIILTFTSVYGQERIFTAFWNVENLFDTIDQPDTDDSEFLPSSVKKWDQEKFNRKVVNLSSVIMSMNNGRGPDILGLCEVENKAVVESLLVYLNPVYEVVHKESPDGRGIDNAMIFRKDKFTLLGTTSDTVDLGSEKTRSILGAAFRSGGKTFSVFVNHWPSRRGGESGEQKRIQAAETLRNRLAKIPPPNFIIAMGDFNDEPENISVDSVLGAGRLGDMKKYFNLAYELSLQNKGSYKYRDSWNMLDQIIISSENDKFEYVENSFKIYQPYFIVTQSGSYAGTPRPTFGGQRYLGGYSDHFPVTAGFRIKE